MTPQSEARAAFGRRVKDWASKLEFDVRRVTVRAMRRKWASCSSAGRLTFDASLLRRPEDEQDYVIVHELLHLAVPNHGRLWKSLMRLHLGSYEVAEAALLKRSRSERRSGLSQL